MQKVPQEYTHGFACSLGSCSFWIFLPRNRLPQKITGEDNISVISLLLLYLHISCLKHGDPLGVESGLFFRVSFGIIFFFSLSLLITNLRLSLPCFFSFHPFFGPTSSPLSHTRLLRAIIKPENIFPSQCKSLSALSYRSCFAPTHPKRLCVIKVNGS